MKGEIYDARGNGNGELAPTITGDHENRITDYTAVCIEKQNENIPISGVRTVQGRSDCISNEKQRCQGFNGFNPSGGVVM